MTGRFKKALLEKGGMEGMSQKSGDMRPTKKGAGMTQQAVKKYRRRKPGSKLKTAVTTPPSKLKPGSKAAKRRKSFCARSRSWSSERGKAARRRWNCSTDVNPTALQQMVEMMSEGLSPAAKKYLAARRGAKEVGRGGGSPKAYGNIPVSPERQEARRQQGDRDTADAPTFGLSRIKAIAQAPEEERAKLATKLRGEHDREKARYFRRQQRRDRQYNFADRPTEEQMAERIKANRARVRQMTTGQTPEETKSQRSLSTANPDWLPKEGQEDTERIKKHKARRGVKKVRGAVDEARMALAEAVLKKAPSFRDKVRKRELQGDSRVSAISKEKLAQDDAKVKAAQGKNTISSTFGKRGTQTSTTAYGGGGGSEEDSTPPMSRKKINRSGSSTVDPEEVRKNIEDAKSGRSADRLRKEIAADDAQRAAEKRAQG